MEGPDVALRSVVFIRLRPLEATASGVDLALG
jgi:hypothetical protein